MIREGSRSEKRVVAWARQIVRESTAMSTATIPTVTAMEAQAEASLFLSDRLPDRISASAPYLDEAAQVWRVPIILAYPQLGVANLFEVGLRRSTIRF